jgi:uncharacterized protein
VPVAGFDWDEGNRLKCLKHGVSIVEIESVFAGSMAIWPDLAHSTVERRHLAIGKNAAGRMIFLAFTLRQRGGRTYIRPISARYMRRKEIEHYEKENPGL